MGYRPLTYTAPPLCESIQGTKRLPERAVLRSEGGARILLEERRGYPSYLLSTTLSTAVALAVGLVDEYAQMKMWKQQVVFDSLMSRRYCSLLSELERKPCEVPTC